MTIPYYYRIKPRVRKPSIEPSRTEESHCRCSQCGSIYYTKNHASNSLSANIKENAGKWPEFVNGTSLRSGVFSKPAVDQFAAAGFTGARFVKIDLLDQRATVIPAEDYFAVAAMPDVLIDQDAAFGGVNRCTLCGEPISGIMQDLIPIAETGKGADFCSIKQYPERDSDKFYWVASWRVVRLILQKRWRNVYIQLLGTNGAFDLDSRDLTWPLQLPVDFVVNPLNSASIRE